MTSAKICHASNMMQDLEKATYMPIATMKAFWLSESRCFNVPLLWCEKIEFHLET